MHICRILIDRRDNPGWRSCCSILSGRFDDARANISVLACNVYDDGKNRGGISVIDVTDPSDCLRENPGDCCGIYSVEHVGKHHYVIMVRNPHCKMPSIFSKHGCFLVCTESVPDDGILWTVVGPSNIDIYAMLREMKNIGLDFTIVSTNKVKPKSILGEKQQEAIRKALDYGYYEVPRHLTLDDLSRIIGGTEIVVERHAPQRGTDRPALLHNYGYLEKSALGRAQKIQGGGGENRSQPSLPLRAGP